jgi:hypothetical protein
MRKAIRMWPLQAPGIRVGACSIVGNAKQLWERACSRLLTDIRHLRRMKDRYREQARSHIFCGGLSYRACW